MCVQNWKFIALPVPETIGCRPTEKNWAVPGYANAHFSPKFLRGFCSHGPCEYACKFEVRSNLPVPEIIAFAVLWWVANPQSWGKGGRRTSYRLSIVTFPLSLRVSEILPLLCSSTPLFPYPTSRVFPKFPHVPLGVCGWLLGHRCDKRLERLQKILCKHVYYFVNVYLNKNLEEMSYSETTVPWFEQREFISDSDSDEDN